MRRFFQVFSVVIALFGVSAPACAASDEAAKPALSGISAWIGKRSFDKVEGGELWDFAPFKNLLAQALGAENMALIQSEPWQGLGPQSEIRQKGDVVLFSLCRQHSCLTDGIKVYVDLKRNAVEACLRKTNAKAGLTEHFWLSSLAKPRLLEEDSCVGGEDSALYDKFKTP